MVESGCLLDEHLLGNLAGDYGREVFAFSLLFQSQFSQPDFVDAVPPGVISAQTLSYSSVPKGATTVAKDALGLRLLDVPLRPAGLAWGGTLMKDLSVTKLVHKHIECLLFLKTVLGIVENL